MRVFSLVLACLILWMEPVYGENDPEMLGRLSLNDAINLTLVNNTRIKVARLDEEMTHLDLDIEKSIFDTEAWAEINWKRDKRQTLNTITGNRITDKNINFGLRKKIPTGADVSATMKNHILNSNSTTNFFDPSIVPETEFSITQPLLKNIGGIQDKGPIRLAEIDTEKIGYATRDAIEDVILEVVYAYWDLVEAKESLSAQREILKKAQELLTYNIENRKSGLVENVDIYASEANVERHMNDALTAENSFVTAREILKLTMNFAYFDQIVTTEDLRYSEIILDSDAIMTAAVKTRRDYLAKRLEIDAAQITVRLKENSRWPQMDLTATFASNGIDSSYFDSLSDMDIGEHPSYFLGLIFQYPLANSKAKAEYEAAALEKAKKILELRQLEKDIAFEVDDKTRLVSLKSQQAAKSIKIEELESKKLDEETRNYELGRSSSKVIIDYQDDMIASRLAKIKSLIELEKSIITLDRARNILFDRYLAGVNPAREEYDAIH